MKHKIQGLPLSKDEMNSIKGGDMPVFLGGKCPPTGNCLLFCLTQHPGMICSVQDGLYYYTAPCNLLPNGCN